MSDSTKPLSIRTIITHGIRVIVGAIILGVIGVITTGFIFYFEQKNFNETTSQELAKVNEKQAKIKVELKDVEKVVSNTKTIPILMQERFEYEDRRFKQIENSQDKLEKKIDMLIEMEMERKK